MDRLIHLKDLSLCKGCKLVVPLLSMAASMSYWPPLRAFKQWLSNLSDALESTVEQIKICC